MNPTRMLPTWRKLAAVAAVVILSGAAVVVARSLPPRTLVMATGIEGSAAHEFGVRYREALAKQGVRLMLQTTAGSVENLRRLRDARSGVSVGIVQGGLTNEAESPGLESLGTLFYEPLWLFRRAGAQGLEGQRISIGPEGSGGRALALQILSRTKLDRVVGELSSFEPRVAAGKLLAGEIDAAFIVTGWNSPVVQSLLGAADVEAFSYLYADALVAIYPFLHKLVLPAGVIDIPGKRPPSDVVLLAPKTSLVARSDLHPALQYLLLDTAVQIHAQAGIFQKAGEFPAAEPVDLPLSAEAQRFYRSGRPFLQGYLPFWIATLIEQTLVVMVPIVALLYPVSKLLPQTYDWMMQRRITRLYGLIRSIESEMEAQGPELDADALNAKLNSLDQRANHLRLPAIYASNLYTLRSHIDLVRARLAANSSAGQTGPV